MSRQAGDRLIKNDLMQLLLTMKGERVMRPGWGTIIKQSLFEPMDGSIRSRLIKDIGDAIRQYEPRIEPTKITVNADEDRSLLQIRIEGIFTNNQDRPFDVEINLPFGGAE